MKLQKSPAQRSNDGHVYQRHALTPMGKTLRRVAELVLHERQKPARLAKRRTGIDIKQPAKRRFTASEVIAMRRRWKQGERICDLAREFNVRYRNMAMILDGDSYAWVRDDLDTHGHKREARVA